MFFLALCLLCLVLSSAAAEQPQKVNLGPDDPVVLRAVKRINTFYSSHGDNLVRTLVKVVDATQQIDSGVVYRLELLLTYPNNKFESCKIKVVRQEDTITLSKPDCVPVKQ